MGDHHPTSENGDEKHSPISVHKLNGFIGAEISGVQISGDLPAETIRAIRQALLSHRVVFFRDQHHLDDTIQTAFARRFGNLTAAHPTLPSVGDAKLVLPVDSQTGLKATAWHTDVTFVDHPPAMSFLRAVVLPPFGGETCWANTVGGYEHLPPPLKTLAESLWALHTNTYQYTPRRSDAHDQIMRDIYAKTVYETEHPVVSVHPETGERALLLGSIARRILGLSAHDSTVLFDLFQQHITRLENTIRWRWRVGDLAIWDNRATQHIAIDDYGDLPRKMHRVTVAGERVKGVDGKESRTITGDSQSYLFTDH